MFQPLGILDFSRKALFNCMNVMLEKGLQLIILQVMLHIHVWWFLWIFAEFYDFQILLITKLKKNVCIVVHHLFLSIASVNWSLILM